MTKVNPEKKYALLAVDDEADNNKFIERTFHKRFKVICASSGYEAMEILQNTQDEIAIIISDQRMPGITGTELLAMSLMTHPYTVKILLTGYTDIEALIEGVNKCELFHYINKPVDPADLKRIVFKGLEKYEIDKDKNLFYFTHRLH